MAYPLLPADFRDTTDAYLSIYHWIAYVLQQLLRTYKSSMDLFHMPNNNYMKQTSSLLIHDNLLSIYLTVFCWVQFISGLLCEQI